MKNQYEALTDIKKLEEKIVRLHRESVRLPEEIHTIDQAIQKRRDDFSVAKAAFDTEEKSLRRAELDLKEKEEFLRKAESKMMEVKNNEEYKAALKENESHKTEKAVIEERVLTLLTQFDAKKSTLKESENNLKNFESTLLEDKNRLEKERERIIQELEGLISSRNDNLKKLDAEIATQYQKISSRSEASAAIAFVDNGMCMNCSMKVRPQLYNEIIGFKAIHRCGNCGKLLVLKPKIELPTGN